MRRSDCRDRHGRRPGQTSVSYYNALNGRHLADFRHYRKIMDLTAQYSKEVQNIWRQKSRTEDRPAKRAYSSTSGVDAKPAAMPVSRIVNEDDKGAVRRMLPGAPQTDHVSPPDDGSGSDDSDDEDDERFSQEKMDALKTRGKGNHQCPKGHLCTKGGVDKDGNLVQFDRNSAFAYVSISLPLARATLTIL